MFNTFCWYLNIIGLSSVAAKLRCFGLALFARHARYWEYAQSGGVGGWRGGVDVPFLGTVAFFPYSDEVNVRSYVFKW